MASESRTAYPLELAAGDHGLMLEALLGSIALVWTRQGGPAYLMAAGERHGFGVTLVDAFRDEGAEVISSSSSSRRGRVYSLQRQMAVMRPRLGARPTPALAAAA